MSADPTDPTVASPPESSINFSHLKLSLEELNDIVLGSEGPGENVNWHRWVWAKYSISNCDNPGVLATQSSNCRGWSVANVELEMNEASQEDKNISWVRDFAEELVWSICPVRGSWNEWGGCPDSRWAPPWPRGWMWGGLRPFGAKSIRAMDIPRVFSPGKFVALTSVTLDPTLLAMFPAMCNRWSKEPPGVAPIGSLQNKPCTNTTKSKHRTC